MNVEKSGTAYFENLDGLRFFAFLAVFVSHAALFLGYRNSSAAFIFIKEYILVNGDVGVSFFFVLSGFLITYLLFREQDKTGGISLKRFYLRRIRRIWPVYFVTLVAGFFILPWAKSAFLGGHELPFVSDPPLSLLPAYMFFLANFALAFKGGASVPTDILWSISVEEQFYLIWPFIVALLPRRHLPKFLAGVIIAASIYRYFYASMPDVIAYSTFSVMSDLAIGSILAWAVYTKNHLIDKVRELPRAAIIALYTVIPLAVFGRHFIFGIGGYPLLHRITAALLPLIMALMYALVIFEQNELSRSFFKAGKFKVLSFLGKISYGFYAYHLFAFALVLSLAIKMGYAVGYHSGWQWAILALSSFIISMLISVLSYYGMEKKILGR